MARNTQVIFLGINDAGMRVYDWLCDQADVFVRSLLCANSNILRIS
jgi:methionyl-tRNA formyltransferase